MLFYSQIKRKFQQSTWKRGQTHFWHDHVQSVKMSGGNVHAEVRCDDAFRTSIAILRGGLSACQCSCAPKCSADQPCEHVAALCIWVVERGSLLRAGIFEGNGQARATPPAEKKRKQPRIPAEPVAFVRPLFEHDALTAIAVEPALRYKDPKTEKPRVEVMNSLVYQKTEPGTAVTGKTWKNMKEQLLETQHDHVPILEKLDAARITHSGNSMLDQLALIYGLTHRERIVFHPLLEGGLERVGLTLETLNVGKRTERGRELSFEFHGPKFSVNSERIAESTRKGCVSSRFFWSYGIEKEPKLYRFKTPLSMITRYANRSGTMPENLAKAFRPEGYAYLEEDGDHNIHPVAAYRLSLELGVKCFNVDPDWVEFAEWKKNFEKKKMPLLPVVEYGFSLRDYQANGLSWMWSLYHRRLAALLGDDMGLGKTHQVMAFLSSIYCVRGGGKRMPSLVVAPKSVVAAWIQKLEKYDTGLNWRIFHGSGRVLKFDDVDIVLTTYGILQKEKGLREREWELVVLDEAQAIKNAMTISSRAARVLRSRYRIAMTGTPIENQTTDLWSVMEFLLPGYLGSLPRFKRLYGAGREVANPAQAETLKRLVVPFLLRRTKSQVLKELPEKTEEVMPCSMTAIQRKVYEKYLHSKEADKIRHELQAEGKVDYAGILALLTRLKQVCDHPRLPDLMAGKVKKELDPAESGKWEAFEEIVNEALGSNLKVVVFTQYLGVLDFIGKWLDGLGVGYEDLRGSTVDRAAPLKRFAEDPECKVFLCSLLAGGLGIDLTSASVCIHFDRWWNPAKENQATDRLHRIGQTRGVQVFKLQCPGTIEDRVASIIKSKVSLSEALIEESPLGLRVFSREDLLELLSDPSPQDPLALSASEL
ncbi:MAG: DEAD/DEAH box helicase [Deltaproteobacteria bacterium]|nr:DEAD/DEAH box helicase [Deltaproteobacteria bacterium]